MTHHRGSTRWDRCSPSPSLPYSTGNTRRHCHSTCIPRSKTFRIHHRTARLPLSHHPHIQRGSFETDKYTPRIHLVLLFYSRPNNRLAHCHTYCHHRTPRRLLPHRLRKYQRLQLPYFQHPLTCKSPYRQHHWRTCPWDRVRMMSGR